MMIVPALTASLAGPAIAQDTDADSKQGFSLMEKGARMIIRGLMSDTGKAVLAAPSSCKLLARSMHEASDHQASIIRTIDGKGGRTLRGQAQASPHAEPVIHLLNSIPASASIRNTVGVNLHCSVQRMNLMINYGKKIAQPIILRYGTPRRPEQRLEGRYCVVHDMWVLPTLAGECFAIDMPGSQVSLMTKTKTHTEQDDAPSLSPINMLQTKTEAQLEQEDQPQGVLISALQTKTDAGREADDAAEMLV